MTTTTSNGQAIELRPASEFESGEPGIFTGVPEEDYHAKDACSQSGLKLFDKCPAAYKWRAEHDDEPTSAMKKGAATHALILEPDIYKEKYVTADQCEAETNAGNRCSRGGKYLQDGKWKCTTHADKDADNDEGRMILSAKEHEECGYMRKSIWEHPAASKLLSMEAYTELTCLWIDEDTGLLCKSRIDRYIPSMRLAIDVKTTRDASPDERGFAREIANRKMYWQAAFYPAGLHENGVATDRWIWIAVENSPPYVAATYEADPVDIDAGWTELRPVMEKFAEAKESGVYPGYSERVEKISMPYWAHQKIHHMEEETYA